MTAAPCTACAPSELERCPSSAPAPSLAARIRDALLELDAVEAALREWRRTYPVRWCEAAKTWESTDGRDEARNAAWNAIYDRRETVLAALVKLSAELRAQGSQS